MGDEEAKVFYRERFTYNDEFKPEMDAFKENINLDPRFKETKNKRLDKQRFSKAVRHLITVYNKLSKKKLDSTVKNAEADAE